MTLPDRVVILSFEGPDSYASVGSLSTRTSQLAKAFAGAGCIVDLIFVGDPAAADVEDREPNLTLRRWSQWISASFPRGVYYGEREKVRDWDASLPNFVVDSIVVPAAASDLRTLVLCEEWQTATVAISIDHLARERGVRGALTLIWNTNSNHGWRNIDWAALAEAAAVTVISTFLKYELRRLGVRAFVVPNGIDGRLLAGADAVLQAEVTTALRGRPTFVKVGRFEPDQHWIQAVDAIVELKAAGINARFVARGRRNDHTAAVFGRARDRGLSVERVGYAGRNGRQVIDRIARSDASIVYLRGFLDEPTLLAIYAAADAVLATSGREASGLTGLEVLAAGGVVVCNSTGEEYTLPFINAIVCDSDDGRELASYLHALVDNPRMAAELRRAGADTAANFTWDHTLLTLELKIRYIDAAMRSSV